MTRLYLVIAFLLALAPPALAQSGGAPKVEIAHAWARATSGKTGGAFLTIANKGTADDRLVAVSTPIAAKAELHHTIDENGIMKMRPIAAIDVKAGGQAELKPGGLHIMLLDLKAPLKEGQTFPLTLTFEKAGTIGTVVTVEKAGAMHDGAMPGMKM